MENLIRTSIKRTKVRVVSEDPYEVEDIPTKWEVLEKYDSFGNAQYSTAELVRAMEKGDIRAFKIEWV